MADTENVVLPGDNIDWSNDAEEVTEEGNMPLAHMQDPEDAPGGFDSTNRVLNVAQCAVFYDSRCRNADGLLQVVYAITTSTDNKFSADACLASKYANSFEFTSVLPSIPEEGFYIHEYYLDLRNPLFYDGTRESLEKVVASMQAGGTRCNFEITDELALDDLITKACGTEAFVACLAAADHDGFIDLTNNSFFAFDAATVVNCDNLFLPNTLNDTD